MQTLRDAYQTFYELFRFVGIEFGRKKTTVIYVTSAAAPVTGTKLAMQKWFLVDLWVLDEC